MNKRIAVLGTGANGASIAADLTKADLDVVLIDQWPEHVEAMRNNGIRIEMPEEILEVPVRAYHLCDISTFDEKFDVVLLVIKAYDTSWASHLIRPYLKDDGLLFLAVPISAAKGVRSGAVCSDRAFSLVVISPYLTNPPPIATMAAINAAIPASWSFILNFFVSLPIS